MTENERKREEIRGRRGGMVVQADNAVNMAEVKNFEPRQMEVKDFGTTSPELSIEEMERTATDLARKARKAREDQLNSMRLANGQMHTKPIADMVYGAYQDFIGRGSEPETARELVQSYALLEIGAILAKIEKVLSR